MFVKQIVYWIGITVAFSSEIIFGIVKTRSPSSNFAAIWLASQLSGT